MVLIQLASSGLGWHRSLFVSLLSLASPLGALLAKVTKDKILHNEYIKIFLLVHGEQEGNGNEALEYRKGGRRKLVPEVANMITMWTWVSILVSPERKKCLETYCLLFRAIATALKEYTTKGKSATLLYDESFIWKDPS